MAEHEGGARPRRAPKYRTSCDNCQSAKVKCGHEKPSCRRCSAHKVNCVYSLSRRMGRPRAKKVAIDDSNRGSPLNTESNENAISKSITPEAITEAAELVIPTTKKPTAEEVSNELLESEAKQISDSWVPLFGSLEQPNGTNTTGESECTDPPADECMGLLPESSTMEFDEMTMLAGMPSFLEDLSNSLGPECSMPALPIGLLGHHQSASLAWPAVNSKGKSTPASGVCKCQRSRELTREDPKSALNNRDHQNQLLNISTDFFQEVGSSSLEASMHTPSNASQTSDLSSIYESNYETSWRRIPTERKPGHCNCAASISQRIAMLKAEQRNSTPLSIDSVLMLEKEVEESLALLHQCKNCCFDGVTHLLALISVRMTLDILQKTARREFVAKAKTSPASPYSDTALCIGSFQVPSRARYRFLRKILQARFHKLAGLIEEREKLIAEDKQDCFLNIILQADTYVAAELHTIGNVKPGSIHFHNILRGILEKPFATASATILIPVLVIITLDWLNYQKQRRRLGNIPIVGDAPYLWQRLRWTENHSNLKEVFQRGYNTFSKKLKPWAYWGQHDDFILVLPPGTCEELKNADLNQMSFLQAVEDSYYFRLHTNILGRSHVDAVRQSVNKNMSQESFAGFLQIWHLVHVVAASFLIGPQFSRNSEYMAHIEDYCLNVPDFVHLYFQVPAPLRKLFWHLSPAGFRVRKVIKQLKRFIVPEIRQTIENWRATGRTPDGYTLLGAMLNLKEERGQITRNTAAMTRAEEERQINIYSDEVIFTAFDSAGPVACLVTQLLFESIRDKSLTEALRTEIAMALANNDGEWSVQMMSSLPRLESFTRETLRVDGPTLFSVTRSVLKPYQLKSGLRLCPGNIISSPSWLIHNDEDNYPKANEFNPYRFYDEATNTVTTKATTASSIFLAYGYGSQMCPGRYLGVRMTQILFAKMLMRYDAVFEGKEREKPENIVMPGQVLPSYYAKIVLRMRDQEKI
ncbi:cytochrome P450 [Trichoderma evansii]